MITLGSNKVISYIKESLPIDYEEAVKLFALGSLNGAYVAIGVLCGRKLVRYHCGFALKLFCGSFIYLVPIIVSLALAFFIQPRFFGAVGYTGGTATGFKFAATLMAIDDIELTAITWVGAQLFFYFYGSVAHLIFYGWYSKKA